MSMFLFLLGVIALIGGTMTILGAPSDIQIGIGANAVLSGVIMFGLSAILARLEPKEKVSRPDRPAASTS